MTPEAVFERLESRCAGQKVKAGYAGGGYLRLPILPAFAKMKEWGPELSIATIVAEDFGATVELSSAAYQVAKIRGDGFCVVVYPHRSTANNYHLRVRDEGSRNRAEADRIMAALDVSAGPNCTFRRNNQR